MEKWAVREIKVYTEKQGAMEKQILAALTENLEAEGIALLVVTTLPGQAAGHGGERRYKNDETLQERDQAGILYVTDCAPQAVRLAAEGYPVLGCLTAQNRNASFEGVPFLAEGLESLGAEYLDRVYRRFAGLPWRILETKRCIVRETTEEDVEAFYRIYAEPSITNYMEDLFPEKEEEIRYTGQYRKHVYEFYGFGIWTILQKETGEVIGRAGLSLREGYEEPELGFVIGVPWQHQGIATEVCEAILQYGERELGFTAIQALTEPENQASIALLQHLGFALKGDCTEKNTKYLRYLKNT